MPRPNLILQALRQAGVEFTELAPDALRELDQRWLETFAAEVRRRHGVPVYQGLRWHGFSAGWQPSLEKTAALEAYRAQWPVPFHVFNEELTFGARCRAAAYPDLSEVGRDVYVVHHNLKWTMAFTHEQPHIGPFFAVRGDQAGRKGQT